MSILQAVTDSVAVNGDGGISALTGAITAVIAGITGIIGWFTGRRKK